MDIKPLFTSLSICVHTIVIIYSTLPSALQHLILHGSLLGDWDNACGCSFFCIITCICIDYSYKSLIYLDVDIDGYSLLIENIYSDSISGP